MGAGLLREMTIAAIQAKTKRIKASRTIRWCANVRMILRWSSFSVTCLRITAGYKEIFTGGLESSLECRLVLLGKDYERRRTGEFRLRGRTNVSQSKRQRCSGRRSFSPSHRHCYWRLPLRRD